MTAKTVKEALIVSTGAVFKSLAGAAYVLLAGSDGQAHQKSVQVGIRNAEFTQIVSGINAGDPVIISGGYALPDKTKIKVEAPTPAEKEGENKSGEAAKPNPKEKE